MISEKNTTKLKTMLERHEGIKNKPYRCTAGKLTIGIGRNLDDVGLRPDEIEYLLENDIGEVIQFLDSYYDFFAELNDVRQAALIDFCFCVGRGTFKQFRCMIMALHEGMYAEAAHELLDSRFAMQVGNRASELASMLRSGVWTF